MSNNPGNGAMPRNSAEYRGDRQQLDALLNLLSELQDRRQTTINVTPIQPDAEFQSPTSVHLPDYLKQLADEAGIDIHTAAIALATNLPSLPDLQNLPPQPEDISEDQMEYEIEEVEDLDAIVDSVSYLQDLLFGSMPPTQEDSPQLLESSEPSQQSPATPNHPIEPSHSPDQSTQSLQSLQSVQSFQSFVTPTSTPQENSSDSSEALTLLQNILVQPEVATLRQSLEQLEQKVVNLEHQVNDPTELDTLDQKLADLQNQFGDKSEMHNVQAELANLAKQQTNLPTELANLKRKFADLNQQLDTLQAQVQLSQGDLAILPGLHAQIASIEVELANLTEQQHRFPSEIALLLQKVTKIEHLIGDPQALIDLLLPLLNELISREVGLAGEDLAQSLAPIIDRIIDRNVQADKAPMSKALAPVLPDAIRQQAIDAPGDFASAIAPELGNAIRDQVRDNADVMVDALYPIIGSTISKYIAEAIRNINDRVENTLSVEGVSRKVRAKLQGVSEAELIFKEAIGFKVQAVFLIHKGSGLIIAEAQPSESQELESEMIAGMLTAIRSFANDCMTTGGAASELDEIDYGSFKILLEVAGFCYLAIVVEGDPPQQFIRKVRDTLGKLVQEYHQPIEQFDGDPETIPEQVPQITGELIESHVQQKKAKPKGLLILAAIVFGLVAVPWGIWQYRQHSERRVASTAVTALLDTPELSIYRLEVEANQDRVTLHGRVPNQYLRNLAEQVTKTAVNNLPSDLPIDNQIIAVRIPPDPTQTASEVERAIATFNRLDGIKISANFTNGKVTVAGSTPTSIDAQRISQSLAQIPGVESVVTTIDTTPPATPVIKTKIFFPSESAEITTNEAQKLKQVKEFIKAHPKYRLKIIGGSDRTGSAEANQSLALERAQVVKAALIAKGIETQRLQTASRAELSISEGEPEWTGRRVEFELIKP
jgi:outer membrane protein OmpA-like peptidoglycan-associated protein/predicted  nucleic acid-binding Zn-ribbon protein